MKQDNHTNDRALGLSTAQVTGSALAAMSGAFFASWLGTTGTLVGAAVGSVVATVGAAIYTHSLRRTGNVVKRTAVQVRHGALTVVPRPDPGTASAGPVRDPNAPRPSEDNRRSRRRPRRGSRLVHVPVRKAGPGVGQGRSRQSRRTGRRTGRDHRRRGDHRQADRVLVRQGRRNGHQRGTRRRLRQQVIRAGRDAREAEARDAEADAFRVSVAGAAAADGAGALDAGNSDANSLPVHRRRRCRRTSGREPGAGVRGRPAVALGPLGHELLDQWEWISASQGSRPTLDETKRFRFIQFPRIRTGVPRAEADHDRDASSGRGRP